MIFLYELYLPEFRCLCAQATHRYNNVMLQYDDKAETYFSKTGRLIRPCNRITSQ